ncbi:esterase-like activity of phytase family protein [Sphingomonas sp.]|jgi:hypothetical protein|uniref:esterase-like activity of phytase family protein n=1 Tax=Sphingomonas sp. TaxID=28214 RepID=UPI002DF6C227|nr:esterase-like activity of phytase family protein [Sphingomonas sp.]
MNAIGITPLLYSDQELTRLKLPGGDMRVLRGIGSGLSKSPDGRIWAIGDRGPNLKVKLAIERYGLRHLADKSFPSGAKLMPCVAIGPAISELDVRADRVEIARTIELRDCNGRPLSGLPAPGSDHCSTEPAIDLDGERLSPSPSGADTEGIVSLADGSFWVGDEYGPSLLRIGANGEVVVRWVPSGSEAAFAGAPYPVVGALPSIAAKRQINRGFEALGISPDQRLLYLAFQSPLAHPDEAAHEQGRWVRVWKLDKATGDLLAQFAYPLDDPATFRRDREAGAIDWADLKVSELTVIGEDHLLFLERGSHTTKFYEVRLTDSCRLPAEHAERSTLPSLEQLSRHGSGVPLLSKQLIFSTDDHPEIGPDLEGMVLLAPDSLLLVNDNDFGVEGVETRFWRVDLDQPLG